LTFSIGEKLELRKNVSTTDKISLLARQHYISISNKKRENHYHVTALLKCSFDITDFYGRFVTVSFPQHCHCRGDLANKEMVIFLCKSNAWYIYIVYYPILLYHIYIYIHIYIPCWYFNLFGGTISFFHEFYPSR
jgi:hypothetical protein